MSSHLRRTVLAWLPTALWVVLVLLFTSDRFSASNTAGILARILISIFGPLDEEVLQAANFVSRKAAHLISYAVLSILAYRASRTLHPHIHPWRWHLAGLGLSLIVATVDEWLQAQRRDRTGDPMDVLIDMTGALMAQALLYWWRVRQSRQAASAR